MKTIVPYTKEITFNTKIAEISSMSLEHELNIKDEEILGDFVISGEYKTHEVSINKDKFLYRLPFSVDLTENVDRESLVFNIEDFNYEIIDDQKLKIDIEFSIDAHELEQRQELEEPILDKKVIEDVEIKEDLVEIPEDVIEKEDIVDKELINDEKNEVISSKINTSEESYITYHVHIIREEDTIEKICSLFNTNSDIINQYNEGTEFILGNKLVIPEIINE